MNVVCTVFPFVAFCKTFSKKSPRKTVTYEISVKEITQNKEKTLCVIVRNNRRTRKTDSKTKIIMFRTMRKRT